MATDITNRIKPLKITMKETGVTYELDFSRESIAFAEGRGFEPEHLTRFPVTKIPEFFWYAFRMHHKNMAKNQTDEILYKIGGLTPKMAERLVLLYQQAQTSNNIAQDDEDFEKNGVATVEMD